VAFIPQSTIVIRLTSWQSLTELRVMCTIGQWGRLTRETQSHPAASEPPETCGLIPTHQNVRCGLIPIHQNVRHVVSSRHIRTWEMWSHPDTSEREMWSHPDTSECEMWSHPDTSECEMWSHPDTSERETCGFIPTHRNVRHVVSSRHIRTWDMWSHPDTSECETCGLILTHQNVRCSLIPTHQNVRCGLILLHQNQLQNSLKQNHWNWWTQNVKIPKLQQSTVLTSYKFIFLDLPKNWMVRIIWDQTIQCLVNNVLERMWKEVTVTELDAPAHHLTHNPAFVSREWGNSRTSAEGTGSTIIRQFILKYLLKMGNIKIRNDDMHTQIC